MDEDKIYFNIWDDYWDDGHAPEGEIQSTYGYIECDLPESHHARVMQLVSEYIKSQDDIDLDGVEMMAQGIHLDFEHLTHAQREPLVAKLQSSGLTYDGKEIVFYSES